MRSSALFLIGAKLIGFSHSLHKYLFFHFIILIIAAEIKRGHSYLPKSGAGCFAFPSVLAKLFSQVLGAIGDRSHYSICYLIDGTSFPGAYLVTPAFGEFF